MSEKNKPIVLKCDAIILKGSRKGELCSKNTTRDQVTNEFTSKCKLHVPTNKCNVLIVRGARKNLLCNKNVFIDSEVYCKKHYFVEIKRPYNPFLDNEKDVENNNGTLFSNMCDTVFDYKELQKIYKDTDPILHFLAH
jgi:hypothetical protein